MLGETPTVDQRVPLPSALSIITRVTASRAAGEDAHFVIDEAQVLQDAGIFAEVFAQRAVERVDRAVADGDVVERLVAHFHFHHGFGDRDPFAQRIVAALDHDAETFHVEIVRHLSQRAPRQQFERRFGAVIGVAQEFALLHVFQQTRQAAVARVDIDAGFGEAHEQARFSRLIGDENAALVADAFRRHVLVGARVFLHGGGMKPALVREGRRPDIGRVAVGRAVEDFVQQPRRLGDASRAPRAKCPSRIARHRALSAAASGSARRDWRCRSVRPAR